MKNNTNKTNTRPINAWTCAISDTERNYIQHAKDMTEEAFYHILAMAKCGFTSPLFYDVLIEEMHARRLQNKLKREAGKCA